jgi:hypothetical protein
MLPRCLKSQTVVQVYTAVKLMNLNLLSVNGPAVECLGIFPLLHIFYSCCLQFK